MTEFVTGVIVGITLGMFLLDFLIRYVRSQKG